MGAGSSADFGVPTLRSIFKNPEAAAYLTRDTTLHGWLERVFWQPRGYSAATSDRSLTIEEMLTIIRDWQGEDKDAPDLKDIDDIRRRLYVLIYHAVYLNKSSNKAHLNGLIDTLRRSFSQMTWASLNWDCIFESSYWYNSGPPQSGTRSNPHLAIRLDRMARRVREEHVSEAARIGQLVAVDGQTYVLEVGILRRLGGKMEAA